MNIYLAYFVLFLFWLFVVTPLVGTVRKEPTYLLHIRDGLTIQLIVFGVTTVGVTMVIALDAVFGLFKWKL